ncbi:unnamed protein product [Symbiodinium sp. CCMP2592]|nr:unnamed protein product [Symbiodinium sp. CCMP2592]
MRGWNPVEYEFNEFNCGGFYPPVNTAVMSTTVPHHFWMEMEESHDAPPLDDRVGLRHNHIRGSELGQGFAFSHMRGCAWGHASGRSREPEPWQVGGQEARPARGVP